MSLFLALTQRAFQRQISYRAATLAGLLTNFFFGLLRASVLIALYAANPSVAQTSGITLQGAVTYTAVSQATIGFLSLFGWYELMRSVHSGEVAADLLKPMGYFRFWLAQDAGRAAAQFLLRGLTMMAAYGVFFALTLPRAAGQWAALAAALLLAWLVSFAWRFLLNLSAFWSPNAQGLLRLGFMLTWFTSGFLMPLRYFPDWFVRLCYLTPFPHTINTVIEIYLGVLDGPQMLAALLAQAGWAAALVLLGQIALRAGIKRLVILGG